MIGTSTTLLGMNRDQLRQALNVVLALAQVLVTLFGYVVGTNSNFTTSDAATPQVIPADYAFVIWSLIYASAIAYAVYQALPQHREDELLRRIGFYTASAYLATTTWLIMAQLALTWLTVICIFWILASLLGAFIQFIRYRGPVTNAQRYLVIAPTSVYTGWATVASIANTAAALKDSGFSNIVLSNQNWAIVMLIVGGLIASFTTFRSRGNVGYALTVIWALIGVVVANVVRTPSIPVAVVAGSMAVLVALVLLLVRAAERALAQQDRWA